MARLEGVAIGSKEIGTLRFKKYTEMSMTGLTVYLLHSLERTGMDLKRHAAAIAPATILFEGLAERPAITKHIFP